MLSIITLVFEFLVLGLFHMNGADDNDLLYTIMILLFSLSFTFDLAKNKKITYAHGIILFGYIWRIALLYLDVYGRSIYQLPNSGADSVGFFREATLFSAKTDAQIPSFFSRFMGTIFRVTGPSQLYGQFLLILMAMLAIYIFARLLEELKIEAKIKKAMLFLVAVLPNYAILSSIFLRESPVSMLLACAIAFFYFWFSRGKALYYLAAIGFVVIAALFHSGSIAAGIGMLAVLLIYDRKHVAYRVSIRRILPVVLLSFVFVFLYLNYGNLFFAKMLNVDSLADLGNTRADGGSTYAQFVGNSATPLNMIIYTIPRIFYFLLSPLPWQWRGLSDIIAFVFSSAFYFVAIWRAIRYLHSRAPKNRLFLIALLIIASFLTFVFAWGVSNTGTATRHREKMIILYGLILTISSDGTDNKNAKTEKSRRLSEESMQ